MNVINRMSKFKWKMAGVLLVIFLLLGIRYKSRPILSTTTFSTQIFDGQNHLLRMTLSGDEKYRLLTPLEQISPTFKEAVLLHEDRHFFQHFGVNPIALLKAAGNTYLRGTRRMGGSTITMQLVRLIYPLNTKTIVGKIQQTLLALRLELTHSKNEILEAYLNLLPYGGNIEGVGAASQIYFGKSTRDLTLNEVLTLAVVPQNPSVRRLVDESHLSAQAFLNSARFRLFAAWLERHPEQKNQSSELALPLMVRSVAALPFRAPHLLNKVLQMRPLEKKLHTTLNLQLQTLLEKKLKSYVVAHRDRGVTNAAAMILNHETMGVEAMVGSSDFFSFEIEGQVNGTLAKRSPGSTLKPLTYALAMDQGLIHPLSLLKDTPMSFSGFDPENFDRNFSGPLSATDALIRSRNVPAVYLTSLLNKPTLYDLLKDGGVSHLREQSFYGLSLSLGGAEVTMEELVHLYSALANQGQLKTLRYFSDQPVQTKGENFLSPEAAFLTLDMLRKNPRNEQSFSDQWIRDAVPVAWKTGTSHGYRDAWSIGVMGPFIIAVWLGNFDGEGNPALIGRDLAAPLFFNLVDSLKSRATGRERWLSPAGLNLKQVSVCSLSGHLPGESCHNQSDTWFIPGKSPISKCLIHRQILISKKDGLRACDEQQGDVRKEIFEFWPSDLLQVFRLAGIPRKGPPAYQKNCSLVETQGIGVAPNITSPKKDVIYTLRVPTGNFVPETPIPLQAVADGDVKKLSWFVGSELVGQSEPQKPLLWKAHPGRFIVRVVDDLGRNDSRELEVKLSQ